MMEKKALTSQEPEVSGFRIIVKPKEFDNNELIKKLAIFKNYDIAKSNEGISLLMVESRDINKKPYKFHIITLKENEIQFLYSSPFEENSKYRALEIYKIALEFVRFLSDFYEINLDELIVLASKFLDELKITFSDENRDYTTLYSHYEFYKKKSQYLEDRLKSVEKSNEENIRENYKLKREIEELKIKLKELETYSDATLKKKIEEWIKSKDGEIDLSKFCKYYSVSETRVEQILNELVKTGYLIPRD